MVDHPTDYLHFLPAIYQRRGGSQDAAFLGAYLSIFRDLLDRNAPVATNTGRTRPTAHRRGLADVIDILPDLFYPRLSFLFEGDDHFIPQLRPPRAKTSFSDEKFDRLNDYFGISDAADGADTSRTLVSTDVRAWLDNLLAWQATWIGLKCDSKWSLDKKRLTLATILPCFRQRGTAAGLRALLSIAFDADITVLDRVAANPMRVGRTTRLLDAFEAADPVVGGVRPFSFQVVLTVATHATKTPEIEAMVAAIKALVDQEKPAHTNYTLEVKTSTAPGDVGKAKNITSSTPISNSSEVSI